MPAWWEAGAQGPPEAAAVSGWEREGARRVDTLWGVQQGVLPPPCQASWSSTAPCSPWSGRTLGLQHHSWACGGAVWDWTPRGDDPPNSHAPQKLMVGESWGCDFCPREKGHQRVSTDRSTEARGRAGGEEVDRKARSSEDDSKQLWGHPWGWKQAADFPAVLRGLAVAPRWLTWTGGGRSPLPGSSSP